MKTKTSVMKNSMKRSPLRRKYSTHLLYLRGVLLLVCSALFLAWSGRTYGQCPQICDGSANTAVGFNALQFNTSGFVNTAVGYAALFLNSTGFQNTAVGTNAMEFNSNGNFNTALGDDALLSNEFGSSNTVTGQGALENNLDGNGNTADGASALENNENGSNNIGLGVEAGRNLTGSNNIDIGNDGVAGESGIIRIGTAGNQTATFIAGISGVPIFSGMRVGVDPNGQLGVKPSSARYKEAIQPMDKASEAILGLKPVTFRYKKALDPKSLRQFGLVAEEVAKVEPDLVVSDEQGKPFAVRYDEVNAMLLNEFLKEHRQVEEQDCKLQDQGATIVELKKQVAALTAGLHKVSAQLELNKPAPQTVKND